MTTGALVLTIILAVLKLLVTCLPNDAVKWITKKFELHPELAAADTKISYDDAPLPEAEQLKLISHFNDAQFLKSKHIFPGNEDLFLHPETGVKPIIIDTKQNKKDIRLYVFGYSDTIDVVKQYKKKLQAYTLASAAIQNHCKVAQHVSDETANIQFEPTA